MNPPDGRILNLSEYYLLNEQYLCQKLVREIGSSVWELLIRDYTLLKPYIGKGIIVMMVIITKEINGTVYNHRKIQDQVTVYPIMRG
jgi:hypothetical protein